MNITIVPYDFEIDVEDYNRVLKYSWRKRWDGRYDTKIKGKMILLHRFILNAPKGIQVDHIDGNPLNNRKVNLRLCNNRQNQQNSKKRSGCATKYKGVTIKNGIYNLNINGKYVRAFDREEDAAKAYDILARRLYGEFSRLNFPEGLSEDEHKRVDNLLISKKEGLSYFTSKHKGIGFYKRTNRWRARKRIDGEWKTIGYFKTEEEAKLKLDQFNGN